MKSTIKTGTRQIIVQPSKLNPGSVCIEVLTNCGLDDAVSVTITQDQAGALIFALEQAAEAAHIAQDRATEAA